MTATSETTLGAALPSGLKLSHEIITPEEETALISLIESSGLAYIDYDPGNPRSERTYGWEYHFLDDTISRGDPLPETFRAIREVAATFAGLEADGLIQCMLLRYDPGSIIQPHCDRPAWDHVIGISLGASVTMEFVRELADGAERIPVELPARSIYLQTGDARHVFRHSLPSVTETRWSITFRDFSQEGCRLRDSVVAAGR